MPIGMQYHAATWDEDTWEIYYYEKNLQGDIVSIYNHSGTKLVYYSYGAWGNFTETYYNNSEENPRIVNNPFTYRGYYYDRDLELYYLNSRYYDSNTGRFINADSALYHNMLGYNMFLYCNNNPVNYVDYTGESAASLILPWFIGGGTIATVEPTPIGEIVVVIGAAVLVGICLAEGAEAVGDIVDAASQADNKSDSNPANPPQSVDEPEDTEQSIKNPDAIPKNVQIPTVKYPGNDPAISPEGYEWKGPDSQGGKRGGYKNKTPGQRDSWHPDFNHPGDVGPHWDYNDPFKHKWRVFPDNSIEFVY